MRFTKMRNRLKLKVLVLFFLALCLFVPYQSRAAGLTLKQLQKKFPDGSYWNGGDVNKTTKTPCPAHGVGDWCGRCSWFDDKTYGWSLTQCWGFAFKCGYDAYGTMPASWTKKSNLNSLKAGDIVRYGNGSHVIFITSVSGNNITYGDCNKELNCKIRWNVKATKGDIPIRNYSFSSNIDYVRDVVFSAPYTLNTNAALTGSKTISSDKYLVESGVGGGQYLTVYGKSKKDRANVTTYKSTIVEHVFQFTYLDNGCYKIINTNSGKSLDIPGVNNTASGVNVQQYSYEGTNDQQWVMEPAENGYFYIKNKCGGYALDVYNGKVANGTNVQLYTPDKTKAQKWKLLTESRYIGQTLADGDYYIRSDVSNYPYLGIGSKNNIELKNKKASAAIFTVKHQSNGRYKIYQKGTSNLFDVAGKEEVFNKKNAMVSKDDGNRDQLWILKQKGGGAYEIINRINGFRLDVADGKNADGTNVWVHYGNGSRAQTWYFEPASSSRTIIASVSPTLLTNKTKAVKDVSKTKDNKEASSSTYGLLAAKASKTTNNSVRLTWKAISGADGYVIYGNACGTKNKYVKLAEVKKGTTSKTFKKINKKALKKGTYYKFIVMAARGKYVVATSKSIHVITAGSKKYGNCKKVSFKNIKSNKLTLKKGQTFNIKASQVKPKGKTFMQHRKLCYESADPQVASVSAKGKVKAKSAGKTKIYVYAQNGQSVACTLTVK